MEYRIQYVPTADFLADIGRRNWFRKYSKRYWYDLGVPFLALCCCLMYPEKFSDRVGSIYLGSVIGIFVLTLYQLIRLLLRFKTVPQKSIRQDGNLPVEVTFDEEGVTSKYKGISGRYPWESFVSLWQQPRGWLLFFSEHDYLELPLEFLDDTLQQFIINKITEVGGRITR